MKRILASLLVMFGMMAAPTAFAQNTSGDTAPGQTSTSGQSTQSSYPGTIPETRFKSNVRFPNQAIFGGNMTVQDPGAWTTLANPVSVWSNIPSIVLRPYGKKPTDNLDTYIIWTTPSSTGSPAARTYTIPDAGGNANFLMSAGNQVASGSFTVPSLILTGTSFNATVQALAGLGQATTYTIPDPGAASDTFMTLGAVQAVTGAKTFADAKLVGTEGTGTATFNAGGKLFGLSATAGSSTGGAVDTTYTLPANSLVANGKSLHIEIYGTTAANGNTKVVNLKFGSTTIVLLNAAASNKDFYAEVEVYRTGLSAQQICVAGYANAALLTGLGTTSAQTETSTIAITADLPTSTANNDVVLTGMVVKAEP